MFWLRGSAGPERGTRWSRLAVIRAPGTTQILALRIDLVPLRADYFASARDGQDEELQRASRNAFLASQRHHEIGNFAIGQSRMVHDLLDLGASREQLVEMATPTC